MKAKIMTNTENPTRDTTIHLDRLLILRDAMRSPRHILAISEEDGYPETMWLIKIPLDKIERITGEAAASHNAGELEDLRSIMEGTIRILELSESDAHHQIAPLLEALSLVLNNPQT